MKRKNKAKPAPANDAVVESHENDNSNETSRSTTDFPPYDAEAWAWMSNQSIPGAFSPILYIGTQVSVEVSKIIGRPMNLEEAKHLVQPDGEEDEIKKMKIIDAEGPTREEVVRTHAYKCASEGTRFRPVRYLPFIPKNLDKQIAAGNKLMEISLPYGGAFYVNKKQEPVPFSGSVFHYNPRKQDYEWCHTSPLVIAAEEIRKVTGRMQWGVPFDIANRMSEGRKENNARREKIAGLIPDLITGRKGLGRGSDAFDNAKPNRNGKGKGGKKPYDRRDKAVPAGEE